MAMTAQDELTAIREAAAMAPLPDRALLRISGSDAMRWLNGMVTNSIQTLAAGQGCYNFLLSAQGRIQADCTIYREAADAGSGPDQPDFLLITSGAQLDTIQQHLERFVIMDDVELTPFSTNESSLLLVGPRAPHLLAGLDLPTLDPLRLVHADTPHGPVLLFTPSAVAHSTSAATPKFEIRAGEATLAGLRAHLMALSIPEISATALEHLRILEGRPVFGRDIRDRDLPQETSQMQALHFSKGCYLGQEIVERIRSRGQVHRTFLQFRLKNENKPLGTPDSRAAGLTGETETGLPPSLPAPLESAGKPAGELTSAALIPLPEGPALFALGYARREVLDTRQRLTYSGGAADPIPAASKP